MTRPSEGRWWLWVLLMAAAAAAVDAWSLHHTSPTYDEFGHLRYGRQVLSGDTSRHHDDSKMPVSALNALAGTAPLNGLRPSMEELAAPRRVTVAAGAVLVVLLAIWSRGLFGPRCGLLAAALAALEPNLHAHARLVTTDLWVALGVTATAAAVWWWRHGPSAGRIVLLGLALGTALLTKFSAVLLFPVVILGMAFPPSGARDRFPAPGRRFLHGAGALLLAGIVLNLGYLLQGTFTPLSEYEFSDPRLICLSDALGPLSVVPVPLPRAYVEGLDLVAFNEATGAARGPAYLFGERTSGRFPHYYPAVFGLKVPLGLWFLVAIGVLLAVRRPWLEDRSRDLVPAVLALALFGGYFVVLCNAQMGIRLALMLIPFLILVASASAEDRTWGRPAGRAAVLGAVLWMLVSVASFQPHLIPYVNELLPDRTATWRAIADSNLDWGQAEVALSAFLEDHPRARINPDRPVTGTVVVAANYLTGILPPPDARWYRWLATERDPADHVASAYLVYRLDGADLQAYAAWDPAP
jgi:4-amino-4-deoxy-L-arabinose transferase-like glycosyltransferase